MQKKQHLLFQLTANNRLSTLTNFLPNKKKETSKVLTTLIFVLHYKVAYPAEQIEQFDTLYSGLRMLWGLLIVLAVILVLYAVLKKRFSVFKQQDNSQIKVLEIKHVMPKKSLILIEVKGQEFLVGSGNDSINTIIPLSKSHSFESVLEKSEQKLQS